MGGYPVSDTTLWAQRGGVEPHWQLGELSAADPGGLQPVLTTEWLQAFADTIADQLVASLAAHARTAGLGWSDTAR